MDDYELERIASDNPALTAPAAQRAPISRRKSAGAVAQEKDESSRSEDSQSTAVPTDLTKYDVSFSLFGT